MTAADLERLASSLRSKEKQIRAEAARSLGGLGEAAIPVLLGALHDPDWVIRYRAVEALGMISGMDIDHVLITTLDDSRDHVRYMAAKMLGVRRVSVAVRSLEQRLADSNEFVRKSAATALGEIAHQTSLGALDRALKRESSTGVRLVLLQALRQVRQSEKRI